MCGELEEEDRIDEELFQHFLDHAARFGIEPGAAGRDTPANLSAEATRRAYMDNLFRAGLTRAVNDAANLPQGERMDALAGQALVFARLAGFLAGQFPPEADLFRNTVSALMDGHRDHHGAG